LKDTATDEKKTKATECGDAEITELFFDGRRDSTLVEEQKRQMGEPPRTKTV